MSTGQEIGASHEDCRYHLDYAGSTCPGCSEFVDQYGNTESVFKYCSFPDCGCNGARLCMAGEANAAACADEHRGAMKSEKSVEISALVTTTRERLQELRYSSSCSCGAFDKAIDLFESAVIAKALDAVSAGLEKVGQS